MNDSRVIETNTTSRSTVQVKEQYGGQPVCLFDPRNGAVLCYETVQPDGKISWDGMYDGPVTVVVGSEP